jgi:hypothetical protein
MAVGHGRRVPPSDQIALPELAGMFAASGKNGRFPNQEILADFPALRSTTWAQNMIKVQRRLAKRSSEAQQALHALAETESFLHPLILIDKLTGEIPGYDPADSDLLRAFFNVIPRVANVLGKTRRGATVAAWHRPAEIVAAQAILAWRIAGRRVIGIDDDSPLSAFVHAWLARIGVHHITRSAVAKVFEKGPVKEWAKSLTPRPSQK